MAKTDATEFKYQLKKRVPMAREDHPHLKSVKGIRDITWGSASSAGIPKAKRELKKLYQTETSQLAPIDHKTAVKKLNSII